MMMSSSGAVIDEDGENEDEFDDYMEQKLLQEAEGLGILDKNQTDAAAVYVDALKRVEEEVKKAPKDVKNEEEKKENGEDEEIEKYQDDLMNQIIQRDESPYIAEYNDVISQISKIC